MNEVLGLHLSALCNIAPVLSRTPGERSPMIVVDLDLSSAARPEPAEGS
jgi:hypothetical protein